MLSNSIRSGRLSTPPFVQPYLNALTRIQERQALLRPDRVMERVVSLLSDTFGASTLEARTAFAHGVVGMMSEHTHIFDGFAVVMPLSFGTAVAIRPAYGNPSRVIFEGGSGPWEFDCTVSPQIQVNRRELPYWVRVVQEIICSLFEDKHQLDVAVVSTVPSFCVEAYLSALGIATARSILTLMASPTDAALVIRTVQEAIATVIEMPFSVAYPVAADSRRTEGFLLIDTANLEHLPIEAPSREMVGWGLIDVEQELQQDSSFFQSQKAKAEEAVILLRGRGYSHLLSLRDLDHQDLQRALVALPRAYRSLVRYLVTENRRVNKLVFAAQRNDWQMLGALLLMSHASRRNDAEMTNERSDFVVEQAESMSIEGMYGASITGRGSSVVVTGQAFVIPNFLEKVSQSFFDRFSTRADAILL